MYTFCCSREGPSTSAIGDVVPQGHVDSNDFNGAVHSVTLPFAHILPLLHKHLNLRAWQPHPRSHGKYSRQTPSALFAVNLAQTQESESMRACSNSSMLAMHRAP